MFQGQNRRKYSLQKPVFFKSLDSWHPPNHVSRTKPPKIFRSKPPKARINEGFRPPIFGHFSDRPKMSILPFARRQF